MRHWPKYCRCNDVVGKIGEIADKGPVLSGIFSGGLTVGALGVGAYGLYKLIKGGMAGSRVLKGMGGLKGMLAGMGGTAAGIAKGKAVEAATGVQPVFVTNWPAGGLGASTGIPAVIKIPGAAKLAALAGAGMTIGSIIAALTASTTAALSLVDAMRGGSGDNWINQATTGGEQLEVFKGKWGDWAYDLKEGIAALLKGKEEPINVGGKIQIEFTQNGAVVKNIQTTNKAVPLDVSTGPLMRGV